MSSKVFITLFTQDYLILAIPYKTIRNLLGWTLRMPWSGDITIPPILSRLDLPTLAEIALSNLKKSKLDQTTPPNPDRQNPLISRAFKSKFFFNFQATEKEIDLAKKASKEYFNAQFNNSKDADARRILYRNVLLSNLKKIKESLSLNEVEIDGKRKIIIDDPASQVNGLFDGILGIKLKYSLDSDASVIERSLHTFPDVEYIKAVAKPFLDENNGNSLVKLDQIGTSKLLEIVLASFGIEIANLEDKKAYWRSLIEKDWHTISSKSGLEMKRIDDEDVYFFSGLVEFNKWPVIQGAYNLASFPNSDFLSRILQKHLDKDPTSSSKSDLKKVFRELGFKVASPVQEFEHLIANNLFKVLSGLRSASQAYREKCSELGSLFNGNSDESPSWKNFQITDAEKLNYFPGALIRRVFLGDPKNKAWNNKSKLINFIQSVLGKEF